MLYYMTSIHHLIYDHRFECHDDKGPLTELTHQPRQCFAINRTDNSVTLLTSKVVIRRIGPNARSHPARYRPSAQVRIEWRALETNL